MNGVHVRTEALLSCSDDGGCVSVCPILIGDSRDCLRSLHAGYGNDDYAPSEWEGAIHLSTGRAEWHVSFNRPAGWRLKRDLKVALGRAWHWQLPRRFRDVQSIRSGDAGRAVIPAERLWSARWDEAPTVATPKWLDVMSAGWTNGRVVQFCSDGIVCIDVSDIVFADGPRLDAALAQIVECLVHDESVWSRIRFATGSHYFQLRGDGWTQLDIAGEVHMRNNRRVRQTTFGTDASLELP